MSRIAIVIYTTKRYLKDTSTLKLKYRTYVSLSLTQIYFYQSNKIYFGTWCACVHCFMKLQFFLKLNWTILKGWGGKDFGSVMNMIAIMVLCLSSSSLNDWYKYVHKDNTAFESYILQKDTKNDLRKRTEELLIWENGQRQQKGFVVSKAIEKRVIIIGNIPNF